MHVILDVCTTTHPDKTVHCHPDGILRGTGYWGSLHSRNQTIESQHHQKKSVYLIIMYCRGITWCFCV